MRLEMHAKIIGNVHGVGFRARTKYIAEKLGLKGYARNSSDGSVEILAQGEKEKITQLIQELKKAFSKEYIKEIQTDFYPVGAREFDQFSIF
ncbi:MAG: acylphosphatase [Chlamydiae bacterium]|nr:acylphosphatase [Chlamydiota bacterium]